MFEFIDYIKTPNEKQLGIAVVKVYNKLLLRYRVLPSAKGEGFWLAPPSCKTGPDKWEESFVIDSNIDKIAIEKCVRDGIKGLDSGKPASPQMQLGEEVPW